MERSDEEILADYMSGNDEKAAEMIFLRYKTRLLNFCLRMLGNRADAEDVTADVFLAVFDRKYAYAPGVKFSTWAYTVARNRCISQIRKRKNIVSVWFSSQGGQGYEQWDPVDPQDIAGRQLEKKEEAVLVRHAVKQLPYEQREAVVLREYHQLNYEEISQILNCSLEKVKVLIFRGRERLRAELSSLIKEDQR